MIRPATDQIALDSNCLSCVIDALEGVDEPKDAFAEPSRVFDTPGFARSIVATR